MTFFKGFSVALLIVLASASVAQAQPAKRASAAPVGLTIAIMKQQRVLAPDGAVDIKLTPATGAIPGDLLVYTLTYRNNGPAPVSDLVLNYPVPPAITYRQPADGSPAPELSVGGEQFGPLASLTVATGQGAARPAGYDDVSNLRWRIAGPVASGAQGAVSFQAALK